MSNFQKYIFLQNLYAGKAKVWVYDVSGSIYYSAPVTASVQLDGGLYISLKFALNLKFEANFNITSRNGECFSQTLPKPQNWK